MLKACVDNRLPFRYVLTDVWYASAENMRYVKRDLGRHLVMPVRSNRKVALSEADLAEGRFVGASEVNLTASLPTEHGSLVSPTACVWLEGVPFPLPLCQEVFTHEDGTQGSAYLVSSDLALTGPQTATIYHKRWKDEEYHGSLKSNLAVEKSPTKTIRTQTNHIVASLCAFVKLERLRLHLRQNHFALKAQLYLKAVRSAYEQLQQLRAMCPTA